MAIKENAIIKENIEISPGIFSMKIKCEGAKEASCGQFVSLYLHDKTKILPRPISICEIDKEKFELRLVYRVAGKGTKEISGYAEGEEIEILGPLGEGYYREDGFIGFDKEKTKTVLLVGGGIGIPPMVGTAAALKEVDYSLNIISVMGYRDADTFLTEELKRYGELYIATDDGSIGTKGNVIDAIKENNVTADLIYSCGPKVMFNALNSFAKEKDIPLYVSMEERMACGVGACLACVCGDKKRVCKDGPVFMAEEVL